MFIDIGLNLTHRQFDHDRDAVLERAAEAQVSAMILTGTSATSSAAARDLARTRPGVLYSTAGVHPHDAKEVDDSTIDTLRDIAKDPAVVAIGECGLDHNRNYSPHADQARAFEAQLSLAAELGLPIFMHERDAADAFLSILRPWRDRLKAAVVHCFTGDAATLAAYLELDLHIGITGWICDERRGKHLRELVKTIPLNRLMIETDAPYLLPRDLKLKTRRNEPHHLPHIARTVAECRGISLEQLAAGAAATSQAFFGLTG